MILGTRTPRGGEDGGDRERREEQKEREDAGLQPLVDLGSATLRTKHGTIHCLTIVGQIEGHVALQQGAKATRYEHVLPLLAALEADDGIDGVLFLLNTMGGDVEAGLAIAELISGMKTPSVSLVLGGGHSIGVPLAVAAQCCMIAPTAGMTIHPVRMNGTVVGAPATFQYFNRIQSQIVDFVAANSHISKKRFTEFMMATGELATDVGTVLYGKQAVDCGLIERLGSLSEALAQLHEMIATSE